MENIPSFLIINIGAPLLIGMAVGYFFKKTLKLGLLLLGFSVVLFFVAMHFEIIQLNGPGLVSAVEEGKTAVNTFGSFLVRNLKVLGGVGVSGCAGFFVGLKMG